MTKADLHNHLRTSSRMDGLLERAISKIWNDASSDYPAPKGVAFPFVLGVVNFSDRRFEDLAEQKTKYDSSRIDRPNAVHFSYNPYSPSLDVPITIIKGQEVPTKQGHLLVLGLDKGVYLQERRNLIDTIKEARDYNGIVIADHPFYIDGIGNYLIENPNILQELDAIEVHNGEAALWIPGVTERNANEKALDFYLAHSRSFPNIGAVSFSDGHSIYEIGRSYTGLPDYTPDQHSHFHLVDDMRTAIRKAVPMNCYEKGARLGALDHMADLAVLIAKEEAKKKISKIKEKVARIFKRDNQ